jgi:hypothetical protein
MKPYQRRGRKTDWDYVLSVFFDMNLGALGYLAFKPKFFSCVGPGESFSRLPGLSEIRNKPVHRVLIQPPHECNDQREHVQVVVHIDDGVV